MPGLATTVGGLPTANPVWVGSSELTMTAGGIAACIDAGAGAVVAKSVNESAAARRQLAAADYAFLDADRQRRSGPPGRGDGLLNRSGLAPVALEDWLEILLAANRHGAARGCPVIASITLGEVRPAVEIARELARAAPALELNVGAPHGREADAISQLTEAEAVGAAVGAVRRAVDVPLLVKLPGQASDVLALAQAARDAGADAVTMVGRYPGFLPDLDSGGAVLGSWGAWGSPDCLPMSLYWIAKARRRFGADASLVGTNGARSAADVARFCASGADAVEIVTALWTDGPAVICEMCAGLSRLLDRRRCGLREFTGSALAGVRDYGDLAPRPVPAWRAYDLPARPPPSLAPPSAGSPVRTGAPGSR